MAASPDTSRRSRSVSTDGGTSSDKNRSSSSEQTSRDSSGPCSLLDRLRRPIPSDLSQKKKIPCNLPKGQKKGKRAVASEPQKVTALTRVSEFPNGSSGIIRMCSRIIAIISRIME